MKKLTGLYTQKRDSRNCVRSSFIILSLLLILSGCGGDSVTTMSSISGKVMEDNQPVANATVTLQGTDNTAQTDTSGNFTLNNVPSGAKVRISAWKEGYYCSLLIEVPVPSTEIVLNIRRHTLVDHDYYNWFPPEDKSVFASGCDQCHPAIVDMAKRDAHLNAATNPRFLSIYYGQDILGNQSPNTVYRTVTNQWGTIDVPEPPDFTKPYYGPGWRLDFPNDTGNCTSCHIPGASVDREVDPRSVEGADKYGVHCDFCHKVGDVRLDRNTNLPKLTLPGVKSIDLFRPDTRLWDQLFLGPLADGNASEDIGKPSPKGGIEVITFEAKRSIYSESRYCAPCHYGGFWGQPIYTSYKEWVDSPYADRSSGRYKTCQDCHMVSPVVYNGAVMTNFAPGKGGIERNPKTLHSHDMSITPELLRNSLTMNVSASRTATDVVVEVSLTNDKTGHHIPTDSPLRHMILLVEARDSSGNLLTLKEGYPRLPVWTGFYNRKTKGTYDPSSLMPGKVYAKILKELWTDVVPTASYWRHTTLESDTRLAAMATDKTNYVFQYTGTPVNVSVKLLYRRAFIEMMEQKKWNTPDIIMAQKNILWSEIGQKTR